MDEQRTILKYIEVKTGDYSNKINLQKTSIDRLQEYRQALITAAVTGQLDIEEAA
jgi:type I restriction enzyme S subunit